MQTYFLYAVFVLEPQLTCLLQQMNIIYLLLGGNLGNRQQFLTEAAQQIARKIGKKLQSSSVYETQAWGKTSEPDYLNQALKVETPLGPVQVLQGILDIEAGLGRRREEKWGSRVIDIDLIFFNDEVISLPSLTVPHPYLQQRRFVLEPLAELSPGLLHPVLKKTIGELKDELDDDLIVKKL